MARSRKEHREAGLPAPKPKRAQNHRPYVRGSRAEDGTDDDEPLVVKPLKVTTPLSQAQAAAKAAALRQAKERRRSQRQAATKKQKGKRGVAEAKLDFLTLVITPPLVCRVDLNYFKCIY